MPVLRSARTPEALAEAVRVLEGKGEVVAVFKEGDEYVIVWRADKWNRVEYR